MRFKFPRESFVRCFFIVVALAPVGILMVTPLTVVKIMSAKTQLLIIEQPVQEDEIETIIPVEILYVPRKSDWLAKRIEP